MIKLLDDEVGCMEMNDHRGIGEEGGIRQLSLQQENRELPEFLHPEGIGVFVEGWALYSESLGRGHAGDREWPDYSAWRL